MLHPCGWTVFARERLARSQRAVAAVRAEIMAGSPSGADFTFARQRRAVAGEPGRRAGRVGERPREQLTCRCGSKVC